MSEERTENEFRLLAAVLESNLVAYDFKLLEILLLLILKGETFSLNRVESKIALDRWGYILGLRPDKLKVHWEELRTLGVIDFNEAQGTYRLRPDLSSWSRTRGMRVPKNLQTVPELPLMADRPLSVAMTDVSMDTALQKVESKISQGARPCSAEAPASFQTTPSEPGPKGSGQVDWGKLRRAIDRGTVAEDFPEFVAADLSAAVMEKLSANEAAFLAGTQIPQNQQDRYQMVPAADFSAATPAKLSGRGAADFSAATQTPQNQGVRDREGPRADFSAAPIASLASDQTKAKLARAAEKSAAARRWIDELDKAGTLKQPNRNARRFAQRWEDLCDRDPDWVLGYLKHRLERAWSVKRPTEPPIDSLAYVASVARYEGKFQ